MIPNTYTVVHRNPTGRCISSGPMTLEQARESAAREDSYWIGAKGKRVPTGKGEVWTAHLSETRLLTLVAKYEE